jgi:L-lactate dehydrogenase complex protein LldG
MSDAPSRPPQGRVLDEIRRALGRSQTAKPAPLEAFVERSFEESREELTARFIREVTQVGGLVYRADSPGAVAAHIAHICAATANSEVALSGSPLLPQMNLSAQLAAHHLSVIEATDFSATEKAKLIARLANCGAGVTAVDYAIAETGTLVLSSDEEQALLVSVLPVIHIALFQPKQILASLTDAVQALAKDRMLRGEPCRSATFITGPSRTSDVELTLSIGVHGPKELHLILLDEVSPQKS